MSYYVIIGTKLVYQCKTFDELKNKYMPNARSLTELCENLNRHAPKDYKVKVIKEN